MKYLTIDRFEEGLAVLETEEKTFITMERRLLPEDAKEGDVVEETPDGYCVNLEESKLRKREIRGKMNRLFRN